MINTKRLDSDGHRTISSYTLNGDRMKFNKHLTLCLHNVIWPISDPTDVLVSDVDFSSYTKIKICDPTDNFSIQEHWVDSAWLMENMFDEIGEDGQKHFESMFINTSTIEVIQQIW